MTAYVYEPKTVPAERLNRALARDFYNRTRNWPGESKTVNQDSDPTLVEFRSGYVTFEYDPFQMEVLSEYPKMGTTYRVRVVDGFGVLSIEVYEAMGPDRWASKDYGDSLDVMYWDGDAFEEFLSRLLDGEFAATYDEALVSLERQA